MRPTKGRCQKVDKRQQNEFVNQALGVSPFSPAPENEAQTDRQAAGLLEQTQSGRNGPLDVQW